MHDPKSPEKFTRHRALREASEIFQTTFRTPDLAAAIEAAGIHDGPAPSKTGPAA